MNVVILSPSSFEDEKLFEKTIKFFCDSWIPEKTKIIIRGNKGVSRIARDWALIRWYKVLGFHADREQTIEETNTEIVEFCSKDDFCIIFHDEKCSEIKDFLKKANKKGLTVELISI